ncbi:hypothetical protein [Bradyrhizobium sp. AZCC 1693]|uniref:hypothetical protein n=1 Tax=Bradyrhizobium sp. AZCC 1693 TaxID=3117029 RepID=UPI002FEF3145
MPPFGATDNLRLLEDRRDPNGVSFGLKVTTGIIAAVLVIAALAQASRVFTPLAAAVFIIAIVSRGSRLRYHNLRANGSRHR